MNVAAISAGQNETVWPGQATYPVDFMRAQNLFSYLFYIGPRVLPLQPGLAIHAESNDDATKWVFHLRDGVTWHNGKDFTADDVVYNITQIMSNPNLSFGQGFLVHLVDFKRVRKLNRLQVEIPLVRGCAQLPSLFTFYSFGIVPEGATVKSNAVRPIGTGPFKFKSFTPGSRSEFERNPDYWEQGKPYFDELVIESSFTSPQSAYNALLSGQVDTYPGLELSIARQGLSNSKIRVLQSERNASQNVFVMRVDKGDFVDNRVRQAFKLMLNRQDLINGAMSGFGEAGNDLLAPYTEYFLTDFRREQDIEKAKSLMKAAGMMDHTFTLVTSTAFPGTLEGATLLAAQANAAGFKVQLKQISASIYSDPAGGFLVRPFAQDYLVTVGSLPGDYLALLSQGCPYPETHWGGQRGGAAAERLISNAMAETDATKAADLWREAQLQQANEGGYIVWANYPNVDGCGLNVRGLRSGANFPLNNYRYCDGWFA